MDRRIPFARKPIRTISGFLELISRFEFDSRRRGFFFERFEFLVCSKFNHTQCGRTRACAVACMHPHKSSSNVVASVTIHDDNIVMMFAKKKKRETIVEGQRLLSTEHHGKCPTRKSFVILGFWWRKTNRAIRWLIPFAVSLRRAGVNNFIR